MSPETLAAIAEDKRAEHADEDWEQWWQEAGDGECS